MPTRVLKTNFTPSRSINSISRRSTGFRQAIFRKGEAQHAAGLRHGVEDGDVVSQQRQVERCGQARRSGAGDGDLAPGGLQLVRGDALHRIVRSGRDSRMESAMKRCTSRMLTASSTVWRRQRLSQGCWQTRPVEQGSGLSRMTDSNASSRRSFFVELQEARDVHVQRATVLAGRQRQLRRRRRRGSDAATMWSSNSWRKCRMVVSTGLGAVWPSPHSEQSRI